MKQRVLVVDDDPGVRASHARLVRALGYDVETASDGIEAITKLALGFDLVLLDLYMPHVDGFEVARTIRDDHRFRMIPIIVITGSDRQAWFPRALEVGANDVLSKPIDFDELRLRTRWLMEMKLAHDSLLKVNDRLRESVDQATQSLRSALLAALESEGRVRKAHLDTIRRLTIATEYRDETIAGHLQRVGLGAGVLAEALRLPAGEAELIRHAAPLHDIGMIGIPDQVLLKPDSLDQVEMALVREHTTIGAALLAGSESEVLQMGASIALFHHERWDGSGYPQGLKGELIPIEARICAVVDTFDAITMNRPYRDALSVTEAEHIIAEGSGSRFEARLVAAFFDCLPRITEFREEYPIE